MANCPLTLRIIKGSKLTFAELDGNFTSLSNCITALENGLYSNFLPLSGGTLTGPLTACTSGIFVDDLYSCNNDLTVWSNVTIEGNVVINGSATTINTEVIQSQDNSITLNYSGTHLTAISGGIVVEDGQSDGVDSSILTDTNGYWVFTPGITLSTLSACTGIWTSNLYGCSPITVHDNIQSVGSLATGLTSFAFGYITNAFGDYSHAEGEGTIAIGIGSHSEGQLTTAQGNHSHAEGQFTIASGNYSHAEGRETTSSGYYSHAEGRQTTASGAVSHAEGYLTIASGLVSHAEGDTTTASGDVSHAEGQITTASGYVSHAEGHLTTASGTYSHAEGYLTIASGLVSHAEGYETSATTQHSHTEGISTIALGNGSHAEGVSTTASGYVSHAEGGSTTALGDYSHAEGGNTTAIGPVSHAEGYLTTASGGASHAEGGGTTASGNYSHAEGGGTTAIGTGSHTEGSSTTAIGDFSHAEGFGAVTDGNFQHAQGLFNVTGNTTAGAFILGNGTSSTNRSNLIFAANDIVNISGKTITTNIQITSGATAGYVLTSDASGNGTWQPSSGGGGGGVTIDPYNNVGSTGTSFNWNVSGLSTNYEVTLTANTTLNLLNVRNGEYGTIIVNQDGVGSRTITLGTINGVAGTHRVANGGGGSPVLTSNASAIDILTFTYNGSVMYWTVGNDYT